MTESFSSRLRVLDLPWTHQTEFPFFLHILYLSPVCSLLFSPVVLQILSDLNGPAAPHCLRWEGLHGKLNNRLMSPVQNNVRESSDAKNRYISREAGDVLLKLCYAFNNLFDKTAL